MYKILRFYLKIAFITMFFAFGSTAKADDLKQVVKERAIDKVQKYFNNLDSIDSDFYQADQTEMVREGRFLLSRPDRMKIEYYTPEEEIILMDSDFIIHYNKDLQEVSYISNDSIPLSLLSRKNLDFRKDVTVLDVAEKKEELIFNFLVTHKKKEKYQIGLLFTQKPFQLSSIIVTQSDGTSVDLKLSNPKFNKSIDKAEFEFKNPSFFNEKK